MAPDTASRDSVPKEPADLKQEASAPSEVEDKPECMGCRAVAFTTPLLISGYLIHTHSSLEKVAAMPIAKNWTGNRRWRLKLHRFNMVCVVPVWLCYTTYDYLFNGLPSLPGTTTDEVVEEPPKNVEEFVQRTVDYTKNDMDSFTRGTLQLADWFITSMGDRRTDILTAYTRFKRMFSAQSSDKDSEDDS